MQETIPTQYDHAYVYVNLIGLFICVQMALHDAAFAGDTTKAMSALDAGFPVNDARATEYANACSTSLHVAAEHGNSDVVKLLLRSGADAALADGWGHTAAHLAALEDNTDILQV